MPWQPIRKILPVAIQNKDVAKKIEATRVLQMAHEVLVQLWGDERAAYIEWVSFQGGQLHVFARAPAAAQELRIIDVRLRNELNRILGGKIILGLNIRHGSRTMGP